MTASSDALSRLLALYPVRTVLDIHCHFGAPWRLEEQPAAAGVARYHMILSGTALLDAEDQRGTALQPGDIVFFPHGSAHTLHTAGRGKQALPQDAPRHEEDFLIRKQTANVDSCTKPHTDILCGQFHFAAETASALLRSLPPVMLVRTAGRADFAGLGTLMSMLSIETETPRPGAHAVTTQLSSALFALLMRAWLDQEEARKVPGLFALLASPRLQRALQCMLSEPGRAWSLEELADACHLSRTTFARLFRATAGATPGEVLTRTRMAQAGYLLADRQHSVADVAEAVGYQSEASFNRVFKRHFHIGPGQYRREARKVVNANLNTKAGINA
ncbi:AraC family transcriptional regulator [Herbaspirillum sp. meg3]|uniref:AraC family transcriptional regulator n=1 Tax=Herbaspirillum sp. meg3 TaxID=2025949 RepID=UPI000B9858B3|nr:AraC family transcriptional regulator [Herbaspirillum sp. meg3]ASU40470.1 AraC family transcriptional regulator [Herbaspirillum sp. meg3]